VPIAHAIVAISYLSIGYYANLVPTGNVSVSDATGPRFMYNQSVFKELSDFTQINTN